MSTTSETPKPATVAHDPAVQEAAQPREVRAPDTRELQAYTGPGVHGSIQSLPISTRDVLQGLKPGRTVQIETTHGNADLIRVLDILGIGGPFRTTSPWELEDERGRHLLHAGGYAALPFGEHYPPLVEFMQEFLQGNAGMGFAQQSASDWRAALEANLVALLSAFAPSHHDSQVFLSNSGAEAIEAALKFVRAARPNASVILNFQRAYHGKTFGALSYTLNLQDHRPIV